MTRKADTVIIKVGLHLLLFVKFSQAKSIFIITFYFIFFFCVGIHAIWNFTGEVIWKVTSVQAVLHTCLQNLANFNNVTTPLHDKGTMKQDFYFLVKKGKKINC